MITIVLIIFHVLINTRATIALTIFASFWRTDAAFSVFTIERLKTNVCYICFNEGHFNMKVGTM